MKTLLLASLLVTSTAYAESQRTWNLVLGDRISSTSFMKLQATEEPGAVAELLFKNEDIHNFDKEVFNLDFEEVTVTVTLSIDREGNTPDEVILEPEEGYVAFPPSLMVQEGKTETFYIYPLEGVGM